MSDQDPRQQDPASGGGHEATPPGQTPPPPPPGGPPPPAAGPQPAGAAQASTGYGGPLRRLGARIIDGLIVGIPLIIVFAVIPGLDIGGIVYGIVVTAVYFGYYVYFETSSGATPGKNMLDLRVTDAAGGAPIDMESSARRNWWILPAAISGIPIIGWLVSLAVLALEIGIGVTISSDPQNQGFHDKMANTLVPQSR